MCNFCHIPTEQKLLVTEHFYVVYDIDPIQEGHLLIISNQHLMNFLELESSIYTELMRIEAALIDILENKMGVTGVTIVRNNGKVMDENTHFHEHMIPRYSNDGLWTNIQVERNALSSDELNQHIRALSLT